MGKREREKGEGKRWGMCRERKELYGCFVIYVLNFLPQCQSFICRVRRFREEHGKAEEGNNQQVEPSPAVNNLLLHTPANHCQQHPTWPDDNWQTITAGRRRLPCFTVETMTRYFVERKVARDKKAASDFSSISEKSFRLFKKGHVQKLELCCPPTESKGYVRCKVHPQMKEKLYSVELVVQIEKRPGEEENTVRSVEWAKCGCPAGKPPHGSCKHLAALFYALEEFCRLGYTREKVSVTSELQKWNVPRKRDLPPTKAEDLDFSCPLHVQERKPGSLKKMKEKNPFS